MKRLTQLDPWELEELGWKIVDGGYASNKADFEYLKAEALKKYKECKVYRVKSDTPYMMCYEVYAKVDRED